MNVFKLLPFLFTVTLLQVCTTAYGQSIAGKIYGTVTDEKNIPLEFAEVRAYLDEILQGGAKTNKNGNYTIKPLTPGTYTLKVKYMSHIDTEISDVPVGNESSRKVDVLLDVSFVKERPPYIRTITIRCPPFFDAADPCTQTTWKRDMKRMPIH